MSSLADIPAAQTPGDTLASLRGEIESTGVVFNDPQWAEIVCDCYGFQDCTVSVPGGSLPLFHTSSPLLGNKIVSAVYNGYASPLYRDVGACAALIERAVEVARARNVAFLELKCVFPLPEDVVADCGLLRRDRYRVTLVPLARGADRYRRYSANFRRNLRRASREMEAAGLRVERANAAADLAAFYDVLVRRYRDKHLMIPQPWRLFELLRSRFLERDRGDLWLVRSAGGRVASGILCLRRGAVVTACFGANDDAYRLLSVDAVLKDTMMEHYAREGLRVYDLGVTSPAQESVLFSKSRFGGATFAMPSYYALVQADHVADVDYANAYMWARRAFRYVPLAVVRRLSPVIVPYLN